jgi:predicted Zn-dependent protease
MKLSILLFLCLVVESVFGFVPTKTAFDNSLKWNRSSLNIQIDPTITNQNLSSIDASLLKVLAENAFNDQKEKSGITAKFSISEDNKNVGVFNTIKFEKNSAYFGSGVLAVTSVSHSASTGEIFSADILINDSLINQNKFSVDSSATGGDQVFIGDVLTHEIGHFLGLGHSDVPGSTMMFSVFKGQHTFHQDDYIGLDKLYANGNAVGAGVISGKVSGGNHIGVFGAQVQAISQKTGKVITSVLSDESGDFKITNLLTDDSYLIYVLPPRGVSHLPEYYASVQTNYCNGKSYVPSFFTKCGGREKGRPQAINLARTASIDLGEVSIRCDEGLKTNYLLNKELSVRENIDIELQDGAQTFLGYFSNEEISDGFLNLKDKYSFDLRHIDTSLASYSLNVKVLTEQLGSGVKINAQLSSASGATSSVGAIYLEDGKLETNLETNIELSQNSNENIIELEVNPSSVGSSDLRGIFGNASVMTNSNNIYLVIVSLIRVIGSGNEIKFKDSYPYSDNSSCLESNITMETRGNTSLSTESSMSLSEEQQPLTCGTIDLDNNSGSGGMMSFCFGILMSISLLFFQKKKHDFFV